MNLAFSCSFTVAIISKCHSSERVCAKSFVFSTMFGHELVGSKAFVFVTIFDHDLEVTIISWRFDSRTFVGVMGPYLFHALSLWL